MEPAKIVHSFRIGTAGAHANSALVKLEVVRGDSGGERMLSVEYPAPSSDPASRDVRLDAEGTNWSSGKGLSFRARAEHPTRISVSFVDRNHVVYTAWTNLEAGVWQAVFVDFATVRPNPYFQPPDAKTGAPLDVSEVNWLAFAPQDQSAGKLTITRVVLVT